MRVLQLRRQPGGASGVRAGLLKPVAAVVLALAMVLSMSPVTAQAAEVDLTPGPTVVADPSSPTGYTGHFVYYNPTATSVRFVADILLRNWAIPPTRRSTSRRSTGPADARWRRRTTWR